MIDLKSNYYSIKEILNSTTDWMIQLINTHEKQKKIYD